MMEQTQWKRIATFGLEGAVILAVGVLVWSNYSLRAQVRRAQTVRPAAAMRAFAVGERLDRVPVVRADGSAQTLDLTSGRMVVAVLNPSCGTCQTTLAQLGAALSVPSLIFASRDADAGLSAVAAKFGLRDRAYTVSGSVSPQFRERFVINPQIFVIDRGKIVRTCDSVAECADGAESPVRAAPSQ